MGAARTVATAHRPRGQRRSGDLGSGRPPVAEQVFSSLLEALLSGVYAPGEKLPPQRHLAADLGVTMTALREALKRLEQMGLIDVRHGDAMRVRDWRAHGGLDVLAHLLLRSGGLDAGVLDDILEVRGFVLAQLSGLAAQRRDVDQLARLRDLVHAFAAASTERAAQEIDFALFTEVAQAAGNLVFVLILNAIRSTYFEHAPAIPIVARPAELAPLYERLVAAIGAQAAEEARHAASTLAARQHQRVREALGGGR